MEDGEAMALGERLGAGKEAEVFALGDRAAKLYAPGAGRERAFREAANLALATARGLPAPAVEQVRRFGDRWGLVTERAPGRPFATAMLSDADAIPTHLAEMVRLHRAIHAQPGHHLASVKSRIAAGIRDARMPEERLRARLLERLAALPDGDRFCHGDFHPHNVLGVPGAAMVIDWLDAAAGPPAADVARSELLLRLAVPQLAERYVDAYTAEAGLAKPEVVAWLPLQAAARLVENTPAETEALLALAATV